MVDNFFSIFDLIIFVDSTITPAKVHQKPERIKYIQNIAAKASLKSLKYLLTLSLVNDSNNKTVNTENTSHDTGDKRLEDQVLSQDTDGADTNSGFGSTVRGSEVSKYEGTSETHVPKEGVLIDSF